MRVMDTLLEDTILLTKASSKAYLTIRFECSMDFVLHLDIQHTHQFHAVSMEVPAVSGGRRTSAEEQSGEVESTHEDHETNQIHDPQSSWEEKQTD